VSSHCCIYYVRSIFIFILLASGSFLGYAADKIKLYALYTPSHEKMMRDYFLPSIKDDIEVILNFYDQECANGIFMQRDWYKTMLHKVEIIIRGIKENWNTFFIHSDVDIQFFKPIMPSVLKAIEDKDIVCQQEKPFGILCAGFIVCRGNEKTLQLWEDIYDVLARTKNMTNDQVLLNQFLRTGSDGTENSYGISWGYLPKTFMGGGTFIDRIWKPGSALLIPNDIIMHHANHCFGVDHKLKQLEYVKQMYKHEQSMF
jgi:hypothetical protein